MANGERERVKEKKSVTLVECGTKYFNYAKKDELIMADLIWAAPIDSTSVLFGFGYKSHFHRRLFYLEHIQTCSVVTSCPDITKHAKIIKEGGKIRQWDHEVLADAIIQDT